MRYQPPATPEEIWAILHEIAARQREADREYQREKKIAKQRINKLEELFTTQWGKLVESLVEGDLHRLLNEWGITVNDTATRRKGLFVIRATGSSARIINPAGFRPKRFDAGAGG